MYFSHTWTPNEHLCTVKTCKGSTPGAALLQRLTVRVINMSPPVRNIMQINKNLMKLVLGSFILSDLRADMHYCTRLYGEQ